MSRNLFFWLTLVLLLMVFVSVMKPPEGPDKDLSYSTFLDQVEKRNIKAVVIRGTTIEGEYVSEKGGFKTVAPDHQGLIDELRENGVQIKVEGNQSLEMATAFGVR